MVRLCYQLRVVLGRSHDTLTHLEKGRGNSGRGYNSQLVQYRNFMLSKSKNYVHINKFDVVITINFDALPHV